MALTRLQMANEVLDNIGRSSTAETQSGATMSDMAVRWLNRAQREIARRYDLLFKISTATTVASIQTYSMPSNIRSLYSMVVEDGLESRKLICVMPWEFDRCVPKPSEATTGRPDYYVPYKLANQFELYRIPDAAYTLRMRHSIWPADLSADGSTSDYDTLNVNIDDVLVCIATSYGWKHLQELTDAAKWYKDGMDQIERVYISERHSFPDWAPAGVGFITGAPASVGEYYNDPFVKESL